MKWDERDLGKIDQLARSLRVTHPVSEATAWYAAEYQYAAGRGPKFRPVHLSGTIPGKDAK